MRTLIIFLGIVLFYCGNVHSQADSRTGATTREIELINDNDYIFFEDYYYTAGQDAIYRRLVSPASRLFKIWGGRKEDSAKVIVQYRSGLKIFNPSDIYAVNAEAMDRPYSGWTFASVGISDFHKPRSGNYFGAETGVVGKANGIGQLQLWVHKITKYDPPKGWADQIRDELVFNFYYSRFQNWRLAKDADIVSQSSVQAGTGGNRLSQDVTLRLIQFNPINNSAFTQSRLSWNTSAKKEKEEIFIFYGFGIDYVLSNIFIEGSLFKHHESVFTVPAVPSVYRRNIGITYSNRQVSCSAIFSHLTKEVSRGTVHDFASLRLAVRF